jgi:TolB-like protein/Tfp pilus assembly protein PilF
MSEIWTDTIVEENNLNKNISVLRRVLGEKPGEHRFIVTVPGHGYKFVAEVFESTGEEKKGGEDKSNGSAIGYLEAENPKDRELKTKQRQPETEDRKTSRFWLAAIIIVTALAGLSFIGFYAWLDDRPSNAPVTSVAVLPFVNAGADPEMEYFSDGISESLIDRLSELPQLKVIARSSSFKYRGENIDLQDAAGKLGVQAIITGRVVRRDENLSIRVELIDARDNRQLWSEQYNRKATDMLAVQQEVAQAVSEQLHLKLSGTQEQKLTKRDTVNPQAYELVLQGRFLGIKGGEENIRKAIECYRQAIGIDPNYALAYAHLAGSYLYLINSGALDPKEFLPKAQAAAQKALELDPNLADARLAMANLYQGDWNWAAAETEFKRAVELNPNLVTARNNYSAYLSIMGRHDEAIAEARRTKELDPLTPHNRVTFGYTLVQARRYDEAIAEFKKILEIDRNNVGANNWLSFAYLYKGMYREAIDSYQKTIRLGGNSPSNQIFLGATYAKAGEREKAQAILKQLETKEYVSPGELAVLYTSLGEHEKAFASFEKAYAAHDLQLQFLKIEPLFDPLRRDPRFQDLLRRVGLPQ